MNYEQLEVDVKGKLDSWFASDSGVSIPVAVLPDVQVDYKLAFATSRIFVCFQHSEFKPPIAISLIAQDEMPMIAVMIEGRRRTGSGGVFETFERARLALLGFQPTGCKKIFAHKLEFREFADGIWYYTFMVTCYTTSVQYMAEETGPPISSVTVPNSM